MNLPEVFIRAKTSDGRWVSVNVVDLDEHRTSILERLSRPAPQLLRVSYLALGVTL